MKVRGPVRSIPHQILRVLYIWFSFYLALALELGSPRHAPEASQAGQRAESASDETIDNRAEQIDLNFSLPQESTNR